MKFLVAGLGSIGRRHLRNLVALGERDIVLYRTHTGTLPDDELEGFPVETNLDAALGHRPNAVIVSNPTSLHLNVAIPAAKAGCDLLIEKPVSHSRKRLDDLRSAVRRGGGRVLVGFQFRFHPTLQLAARLLSEGAIGRAFSARAHWGEYLPDWHPWEDYRESYAAMPELGGGVVLTLCHPLDYVTWLLGEPTLAWSFTDTLGDLGIQVEDVAEIGIRFQDGAIASIHMDFLQQPPAHHIEILGTNGTLRWNNADGSLLLLRSGQPVAETFAPPAGFERNHMFLDEMRHFLAVVRSEAAPVCGLENGIRTLELALKALEPGVGEKSGGAGG